MHPMGDDLGVGVGGEFVAQSSKFFAEFFVILDDAVVNDGYAVA